MKDPLDRKVLWYLFGVFIATMLLIVGVVAWFSYKQADLERNLHNTDSSVQRISEDVKKNTKTLEEVNKQIKGLSERGLIPGPEGPKGDKGENAVSEKTTVEKKTLEQVPVNGTNGESAYQSWLKLGNVGTEQEFMDSLKGENARQIELCYVNSLATILGWRYVGERICSSIEVAGGR